MKRKLLLFGVLVLLVGLITPRNAQAEFYVVDSNHDFGTLNPVTGVFTHVAFTTPIFDSLAVTPNRTLYGEAENGNLYTINPTTGATTLIGNSITPPDSTFVWGLAAQNNTNLSAYLLFPLTNNGTISSPFGTVLSATFS